MKTMTSRERIERTLQFQEPDRVPIDLGALKASGIVVESYHQLKRELGLGGPPRVFDPQIRDSVPA